MVHIIFMMIKFFNIFFSLFIFPFIWLCVVICRWKKMSIGTKSKHVIIRRFVECPLSENVIILIWFMVFNGYFLFHKLYVHNKSFSCYIYINRIVIKRYFSYLPIRLFVNICRLLQNNQLQNILPNVQLFWVNF